MCIYLPLIKSWNMLLRLQAKERAQVHRHLHGCFLLYLCVHLEPTSQQEDGLVSQLRAAQGCKHC